MNTTTLGQKAKDYEPKRLKTVDELTYISTDMTIEHEEESDYPYDYVLVGEERYRVPVSVIGAIKDITDQNASLKWFKVTKSGQGATGTKYTAIPIIESPKEMPKQTLKEDSKSEDSSSKPIPEVDPETVTRP